MNALGNGQFGCPRKALSSDDADTVNSLQRCCMDRVSSQSCQPSSTSALSRVLLAQDHTNPGSGSGPFRPTSAPLAPQDPPTQAGPDGSRGVSTSPPSARRAAVSDLHHDTAGPRGAASDHAGRRGAPDARAHWLRTGRLAAPARSMPSLVWRRANVHARVAAQRRGSRHLHSRNRIRYADNAFYVASEATRRVFSVCGLGAGWVLAGEVGASTD